MDVKGSKFAVGLGLGVADRDILWLSKIELMRSQIASAVGRPGGLSTQQSSISFQISSVS